MPKIVVFGAGGCVGGWVSEELASRKEIDPVACLRHWAAAPRVARRGIPISQFDLERGDSLAELLSGADAVINAAKVPPQSEADMVVGLYRACATANVKRFVQFSSTVVYGTRAGDLDEDSALAPTDDYSAGKADMEKRLMEAAAAGPVQCVILRPSIVYGPFAAVWTAMYAQRIVKGRWRTLGAAGTGTCNMVHAHDLAKAAVVAATTDLRGGPHLLNIAGPEVVSWNEYIERFGDALEVAGRNTPSYAEFMGKALFAQFTRKVGAWVKAKGLYRKGGRAEPVASVAKALVGLYPQPAELALLARKVRYRSDRCATALGFSPSISLTDGLRQSAHWCRVHGIV
jgi:nucleoside-diphosphate-sugar epimerase